MKNNPQVENGVRSSEGIETTESTSDETEGLLLERAESQDRPSSI